MKTTLLFLSAFLSVSLFGQQMTYIPDDGFEQNLINMGLDDFLDDYVVTDSIININVLLLGGELDSLTGIEDFISLDTLICNSCGLSQVNISNNSELIYLSVHNNNLTSLDVSNNFQLSFLNCSFNQLSELNLTSNAQLTHLNCSVNELSFIDLSNISNLIYLNAGSNQLSNINVSSNTDLVTFHCSANQISSIDISQNINLTTLGCSNNNLLCLDMKNGHNLLMPFFYAINNPLLDCIEVDDAAWSAATWTNIDPQTSFSENCNYSSDCFTTSVDELTTSKNLIQILDMMGRETSFKPNTPLIYVYDDGSTEKVFTIE